MVYLFLNVTKNVVDLITCKDVKDFVDFQIQQTNEGNIIQIIGIYQEDEKVSKLEEDYAKFVKYYKTGQKV